jgi:NADPH:quinone reductase
VARPTWGARASATDLAGRANSATLAAHGNLMGKVIRFHQRGGPEVLQLEEHAVGDPGPGEARVRQTAVGVNFVDTYHRSGREPVPLPSGLGVEGAGVVEAVGEGVRRVRVGDRVAYVGGPPGAYCEARLVAAERLFKLPEGISERQAAGAMLKGLAVQYLVRRAHPVRAGETILVHAAAGGVGLIACQWLKALGATVIGSAGSDDKAELARAHGADHVIVATREDVPARVRELTGGRGVAVVYDSVGKATFLSSLDCLQPLGLLVSFGSASGAALPRGIGALARKGWLSFSRPSRGGAPWSALRRRSLSVAQPRIDTCTARREDLEPRVAELFEMVLSGKVNIAVRQAYPLAEAAHAHRELEARRTTGSTILLP